MSKIQFTEKMPERFNIECVKAVEPLLKIFHNKIKGESCALGFLLIEKRRPWEIPVLAWLIQFEYITLVENVSNSRNVNELATLPAWAKYLDLNYCTYRFRVEEKYFKEREKFLLFYITMPGGDETISKIDLQKQPVTPPCGYC